LKQTNERIKKRRLFQVIKSWMQETTSKYAVAVYSLIATLVPAIFKQNLSFLYLLLVMLLLLF